MNSLRRQAIDSQPDEVQDLATRPALLAVLSLISRKSLGQLVLTHIDQSALPQAIELYFVSVAQEVEARSKGICGLIAADDLSQLLRDITFREVA